MDSKTTWRGADPVASGDEQVATRLAEVRSRMDAAASAAGRNPNDVRLVAVSKRLGADAVREAYAAGLRDFGENYVQEAVAKIGELGELGKLAVKDAAVRWHFLGSLQSNKAALAVQHFALLHGIDSLRTVAALSRAASREGRVVDVLVQVRLGDRTATRGGIEAEDAPDFLAQSAAHENVRIVGLMGVADPDLPARRQFAGLRELSEHLAALGLERAPLGELSMGMTGDFEDAVAEGSTLVRIGTAIFGERPAN